MMRRKRAAALGAAALFAAVGVVGIVPTAASADAYGGKSCSAGAQAVGTYWTSGGARTTEVGDCGTLGARVGYILYPGSPTYWTGWVYGSSKATAPNPGNTQKISQHSGTKLEGTTYFNLTDP